MKFNLKTNMNIMYYLLSPTNNHGSLSSSILIGSSSCSSLLFPSISKSVIVDTFWSLRCDHMTMAPPRPWWSKMEEKKWDPNSGSRDYTISGSKDLLWPTLCRKLDFNGLRGWSPSPPQGLEQGSWSSSSPKLPASPILKYQSSLIENQTILNQ